MTTVPDVMSIEYGDMLRRGAELDRLMHALGWMRGKKGILGPNGERLPRETPDEALRMAIEAASQLPGFGIKGISKAA